MKGTALRGSIRILMLGILLWGSGPDRVLAQLSPEVIEDSRRQIAEDQNLDPQVKKIALEELLPKLEESVSEEASAEARREARKVERTAAAIHTAMDAALEEAGKHL